MAKRADKILDSTYVSFDIPLDQLLCMLTHKVEFYGKVMNSWGQEGLGAMPYSEFWHYTVNRRKAGNLPTLRKKVRT